MKMKHMAAAIAALMLTAFAAGMEFANVRHDAAQARLLRVLSQTCTLCDGGGCVVATPVRAGELTK